MSVRKRIDWMRDRSGRSGRRRGSQKPGTAAPRGSVTPSWADAGRPPVKAANSAQTASAIGNDRDARGWRWDIVIPERIGHDPAARLALRLDFNGARQPRPA